MSSPIQKRESRKAARPEVVLINEITWTLCDDLPSRGARYRMFCECGAERIALPKNLHQITKCDACTKRGRYVRRHTTDTLKV